MTTQFSHALDRRSCGHKSDPKDGITTKCAGLSCG
jgi:hypothetical protein